MRGIKYLSIFLLLISVAGCTTMLKEPYFMGTANYQPESQKLWTRPTEVSYTFGNDIMGTAMAGYIFGVVTEGEAPPSVSVQGLVGSADPLVKLAAWNAINSSKADGIYVTQITLQKSGIWPFIYKKEASVKGKALILKNMGEVDQKRYDNERIMWIQNSKKALFAITNEINKQ